MKEGNCTSVIFVIQFLKKDWAVFHKPYKCKICDKTFKKKCCYWSEDMYLKIDHTFGTHIKFRVDWYPIGTCYKFSDSPWFSDSFQSDQKCH